MKKLLLFISAFCFSTFLIAQTSPVRELAPGVYFYFGDELQHKPTNCVWIIFNEYVLVIDANYPWGAKEIISEIRKTTTKPIRFVFNTHYHHDHSFGNCVFADAGATIVSTKQTLEEMKTLGQIEWDQNYSGQSLKGYRRVFPDLTFDRRLIFDDGEHRVELMNMGQAHTKSDAVVYLPKERILITGDLFVNGNPWGNNLEDPHADYDKWLHVLDTLISWNAKTIVPGHGELGSTSLLIQQRDFLADLLRQVRQGFQSGKSIEELLNEIDLSKYPLYGKNKISIARSARAIYKKLKVQ